MRNLAADIYDVSRSPKAAKIYRIIFAFLFPGFFVGLSILYLIFGWDSGLFEWLNDHNPKQGFKIGCIIFVTSFMELLGFILIEFYANWAESLVGFVRRFPLMPAVQALLLLSSNVFTFVGVTSSQSVILLAILALGALTLESAVKAYDLNLSTTIASITMAMAYSVWCTTKDWRLVLILPFATFIFFITGKFYVAAPDNGGGSGGVRARRKLRAWHFPGFPTSSYTCLIWICGIIVCCVIIHFYR